MKKLTAILLISILISGALAACGSNKAKPDSQAASVPGSSMPDSSASPKNSESGPTADDSSIPEHIVGSNPYPGQTSMGGQDIRLVMYAPDPETEPPTIRLTLQQQNGIAQELQSVMARYASGEYPQDAAEDTDAPGFYPGWPKAVDFPKTVPVKQLIFSTVGHETYPMSVQVALPKGWYMECALAVQAESEATIDLESDENVWIPVAAHFIDPNGLVHADPGETDMESGAAIVLS